MSLKKVAFPLLAASLISVSSGCATTSSLNTVPLQQTVEAQRAKPPVKELPKIKLFIKKAEIDVMEADLNAQIAAILAESNEKRLQDMKMKLLPNNIVQATGIIAQKIPFKKEPIKVNFSAEGPLTVLPGNTIKFDPTKVKVAGLSVRNLMKIIGLELSNFTKFKDRLGRVELDGSAMLLKVEKFSDDVTIEGQISKLRTGNKKITVIF